MNLRANADYPPARVRYARGLSCSRAPARRRRFAQVPARRQAGCGTRPRADRGGSYGGRRRPRNPGPQPAGSGSEARAGAVYPDKALDACRHLMGHRREAPGDRGHLERRPRSPNRSTRWTLSRPGLNGVSESRQQRRPRAANRPPGPPGPTLPREPSSMNRRATLWQVTKGATGAPVNRPTWPRGQFWFFRPGAQLSRAHSGASGAVFPGALRVTCSLLPGLDGMRELAEHRYFRRHYADLPRAGGLRARAPGP